jgi:hypothetical protein
VVPAALGFRLRLLDQFVCKTVGVSVCVYIILLTNNLRA